MLANSPASRALLGILVIAMGLAVDPAAAQVVISPDDPTDRILLHHQKAQEWARENRHGILPLEAVQRVPRGFNTQLAPRLQGAAILVATAEGNLLIAPAHLVENASAVTLLLPSGARISIQGIHLHPDVPIAGLVANELPPSLKALRIAETEEATEGRRALHISGLHVPAQPALSRAHLLRRPLPPLARYWITDVVHPDGHPLLTPDGALLAIAFRKLQPGHPESLAIGPLLLSEVTSVLARPDAMGQTKPLK